MECPHCHRQVSSHAKNCRACGGHIPPGQHLLEEAGIATPQQDFSSSVPASRVPPQAPMARLRDRFLAFVIDLLALFGVFALIDAFFFLRWGRIEGAELNLTAAALLVAALCNVITLFLYGWLLEAVFGATLGKTVLGIRVVRSGRRSALAASAIRNAMRILDGFGFYFMGALVASCSRCRQRLGDLCAGTAVVEAEFGKLSKLAALAVATAILAGAGWAMPRLCSKDRTAAPTRYFNDVIVSVGRTENSAYFKIARVKFEIELNPQDEISRR